MMNKQATALIVVALVLGSIGFYGGALYGKRSLQASSRLMRQGSAAERQQMMGQSIGRSDARNRAFGDESQRPSGTFVRGEIIQKDAQSITIKTPDSGSKIIFINAGTRIERPSAITLSELALGEQVTASGQESADGSLAAQMLQARNSRN